MRFLWPAALALLLSLAGALPPASEARGLEPGPEEASVVASLARVPDQEHPGRRPFRQYCAPCHGEKGRGDGPAAVAFHPPPADFADPEGLAKLTDEEVLAVITRGRGSMPAWGAILQPAQVTALLAYLRVLSRGEA